MPKGMLFFQIFSENAFEKVNEFNAFPQLEIPVPEEEPAYLANITFGTMRATTIDQPWFGIKAGTAVVLHIVNVITSASPKIGIGTFANWDKYGVLAGQIVQAMSLPKNAAMVAKMREQLLGVTPQRLEKQS